MPIVSGWTAKEVQVDLEVIFPMETIRIFSIRVTGWFAAIVFCSACSLFAHQDPVGDVHPTVRVENGNFAVYFRNNTVGDSNYPEYFRVLYSPDGKLLAPRHDIDPAEVPGLTERYSSLSSVSEGKHYSVPKYHRLHFGRPYYTVQQYGRAQRYKIPWPDDTQIEGVHDMVVADGVMWLAGPLQEKENLYLFRYPLDSLEPPAQQDLGNVAMIYTFPVASNLVVIKGACYIVWNRYQDEKLNLVLTKWDGASGKVTDVVLSENVDFNLSISLAHIGDKLCIAYHRSSFGDYPGWSVIETLFRPID